MQPRAVLQADAPDATDAVQSLLLALGEDPGREGLVDTPRRYVKALAEMTSGYAQDPAQILARTFEEAYAGTVAVKDIPFWSLCEHHLLPFSGTVDIEYRPQGRVVGLSKLSRLVHCFARRLQMQERMTREIAEALREHLDARDVHVRIVGHHTCMAARGARTPAPMHTELRLE